MVRFGNSPGEPRNVTLAVFGQYVSVALRMLVAAAYQPLLGCSPRSAPYLPKPKRLCSAADRTLIHAEFVRQLANAAVWVLRDVEQHLDLEDAFFGDVRHSVVED